MKAEQILKPGFTVADLKPGPLTTQQLEKMVAEIDAAMEEENAKPTPWNEQASIDMHRPMSI